MSQLEGKGIDALWFDAEGCGPFPLLGGMDLRAKMLSFYYPDNELMSRVDDLTVRVSLEAKCFGGLMMTIEDARNLSQQLADAAIEAEVELNRLMSLEASNDR